MDPPSQPSWMPSLHELDLYEHRRREERGGWTVRWLSPPVVAPVADPDTVVVVLEERS